MLKRRTAQLRNRGWQKFLWRGMKTCPGGGFERNPIRETRRHFAPPGLSACGQLPCGGPLRARKTKRTRETA
jgi:hypothetical protein